MSSKADDFDVRYRDAGTAGHGRPAADGGYRGNAGDVDYDLGYDSTGWDTQGFRRPEADFTDSHETGPSRDFGGGGVGTAVRPDHGRAPRGRREGSHARAAGPEVGAGESTQLNWENEATGAMLAPELPVRGRRANRGGGRGGSGGPGGPRGPRGSRALVGPGRRGAGRPRVKVKGSWWRHWTLRKAVGVLLGVVGAFVVLGAVAVVVAYEETPVPTAALAATGFSQSVVYSKNGDPHRPVRHHQPQDAELRPDSAVGTADQRGARRRGQELLQRGRHLAHRHRCAPPTRTSAAATARCRAARPSPRSSSGSTTAGIGTQQTFSRKIKEIFVAMKVAKEKSKQWILHQLPQHDLPG